MPHIWCPEEESNLHALRHTDLNLSRHSHYSSSTYLVSLRKYHQDILRVNHTILPQFSILCTECVTTSVTEMPYLLQITTKGPTNFHNTIFGVHKKSIRHPRMGHRGPPRTYMYALPALGGSYLVNHIETHLLNYSMASLKYFCGSTPDDLSMAFGNHTTNNKGFMLSDGTLRIFHFLN